MVKILNIIGRSEFILYMMNVSCLRQLDGEIEQAVGYMEFRTEAWTGDTIYASYTYRSYLKIR